jgi:hypothetical protein
MKHAREFKRCMDSLNSSTFITVEAAGYRTVIDGRRGTCPTATWFALPWQELERPVAVIENDKFRLEMLHDGDATERVPGLILAPVLRSLEDHGAIGIGGKYGIRTDGGIYWPVRFSRKPQTIESGCVLWVKTNERMDFAQNPFIVTLPPEFSTYQPGPRPRDNEYTDDNASESLHDCAQGG